jgi:signal transduction histidine kinase
MTAEPARSGEARPAADEATVPPRKGLIERLRPVRRSITRRFLFVVVVASVLFGAFAAIAVTLYSVQTATQDHRENRSVLTLALGESLVGDMRPQDTRRLTTAVAAVQQQSSVDIIGVRVAEPDGTLILQSGQWPEGAINGTAANWVDSLTKPMVVSSDILDSGTVLGRLLVVYKPIGVLETLGVPLVSTSLLMLFAVLASTGWATWTMVRTVAQPVARLRDSASAIAEGRRDVPLPVDRDDELGDLARGIEEMMVQLGVREREITDSYRSLEGAYKWQARLKGDLETALRTRSDFLAVASHEIRSPLAVIHMYAEMLRDGEFGALKEAQTDAADSMVSASSRLTSIVADLMDVALLDRGLMPLRFGAVVLDNLAEAAVHDVVTLGKASRVDVTLLPGLRGVRIPGDETRIRQILDNLLTNAIKYSEPQSPVTVQLVDDGDFVQVRVVDRGPGIPPESREELFEMFSRLRTEDNADDSGLGLGLAISKRIAEAHGGDLSVDNDKDGGRGAVFVLRLPYHGAENGGTARIRVV